MGTPDTVEMVVIVASTLVFAALLIGPSLFSSYQNWKMKKGVRR
jgi:hypothetical protein